MDDPEVTPTIEVNQTGDGTFEAIEVVPEQTVVVPEKRTPISQNLEADIEMQTGLVAEKQADLKDAQDKLDQLNALLKQGQDAAGVIVDPAPVDPLPADQSNG